MRTGKATRLFRAATAVTCGLSVLLGSLAASPAPALADTTSDLQAAQAEVQQCNQAYEEATDRLEELQDQIDANEGRISQIEAELPAQQELAEDSLRALYKMQQGSGSLVDLLLSSEDFYDLLATIQYLDVIQSKNAEELDTLVALENELRQTQVELDSQREEAQEEQENAEEALESAERAQSDLEDRIAAQAAAEEAERRAALEAAQRAAAEAAAAQQEEATFTTESGAEAPVEVPESQDPGTVDITSDKDAFVAEWSGRIDAYLAGSPLAGQGATFAEAAWEYGVDPRFSPAIATVESGNGAVCFLPHNAWGWGSSSWGSWEEAIWDHVAGLASGYGGQLTYAGAQKYCPPNADHWYTSVLANMERI